MRFRSALALAFASSWVLGCAVPQQAPAAEPRVVRGQAHNGGGLTISVHAPETATYDPDALGIGGRTVTLHIHNDGDKPASIAGLQVTSSASRDGVAFPCVGRAEPSLEERVPAMIGPRSSMDVDRELGCSMPLPGRYDVRVFARTEASSTPRLVGAFSLDVVASARAPRPLGAPGLFALLTGRKFTQPLADRAWREGDYHVVLAVINGSKSSIGLGPAKVSFVVYKKGSPYPCTSEAKPVSLPAELASGGVFTTQLPISCAPTEEGQYEVSARLSLEGAEEIEIGRLGLQVTRDPLLFTPLPITPLPGTNPR